MLGSDLLSYKTWNVFPEQCLEKNHAKEEMY